MTIPPKIFSKGKTRKRLFPYLISRYFHKITTSRPLLDSSKAQKCRNSDPSCGWRYSLWYIMSISIYKALQAWGWLVGWLKFTRMSVHRTPAKNAPRARKSPCPRDAFACVSIYTKVYIYMYVYIHIYVMYMVQQQTSNSKVTTSKHQTHQETSR